MYDGRLGRRWNQDPVVKPWRSSYDAFSNNPIIKVDPKGDDDYFDTRGNWLGNDGTSGHLIRITTKDVYNQFLTNVLSGAHEGNQVGILQKNSARLAYIQFNERNRPALDKIATHYYKSIGGEGFVKSENYSEEGTLAYTGKDLTIYLATKNGVIDKKLGDYNNLKSTLGHEGDHKRNDDPNERSFNYKDHANVYLRQAQNSGLFQPTSDEFKEGHAGSAAKYLISAYNKGEMSYPQVKDYIAEYNAANPVAQMEPTGPSNKLGISFNITESNGNKWKSQTEWEGAKTP